jgi:acetaldehyde dehydrogenase (acetylating)
VSAAPPRTRPNEPSTTKTCSKSINGGAARCKTTVPVATRRDPKMVR